MHAVILLRFRETFPGRAVAWFRTGLHNSRFLIECDSLPEIQIETWRETKKGEICGLPSAGFNANLIP